MYPSVRFSYPIRGSSVWFRPGDLDTLFAICAVFDTLNEIRAYLAQSKKTTLFPRFCARAWYTSLNLSDPRVLTWPQYFFLRQSHFNPRLPRLYFETRLPNGGVVATPPMIFHNKGPMILYLVPLYRYWSPLNFDTKIFTKKFKMASLWRHNDVIMSKSQKYRKKCKILILT